MSEDKEKNNENKPTNNTKEVIFETTYEKVLFIINLRYKKFFDKRIFLI